MRRKRFFVNPKHLLIVLAGVCVGLMFVSFRYGDALTPIKTAVGNAMTPMQKGINTLGRYISGKMDAFASVQELLEENERLKEEVENLSYENKLLQQQKYELDNLRELYDLGQRYSDYPMVAARIIDKDPGGWYHRFKIDKGANDGLTVDMNVIAGNGLVGIITEVGQNYSIVRSIIDDKSSVSGMFLTTSDTCIVNGDLTLLEEGIIRVEAISSDAGISENDEVVTSHISDKYLQGILIGYIQDITLDANNMTYNANLVPAVDFAHLEDVLVITQIKEPLMPLEEEAEGE
ncbi:MAG: rod shape-determining protein MreC [Lachnospiraceae bacterium]|nr:rod shape-determining protein MreC [Lachnospiraceae bacterium]